MRAGYRQFCAIARTLDLVGQRWALLVVRELLLRGPLPAAGIARGLPDVPMNQLVERLARLEARGLVSTPAARDGAPGRAYELTDAGRELGGVLEALARFGLARLAGDGAEPDDAVLPHVLMRQLELRYDGEAAAEAGFAGRFELRVVDPQTLWSVDPGTEAPDTWAVVARGAEVRIRAGGCLDPDATLELSVDACTRLIARHPDAGVEVEVSGDRGRADRLLGFLGADVPANAAAAA